MFSKNQDADVTVTWSRWKRCNDSAAPCPLTLPWSGHTTGNAQTPSPLSPNRTMGKKTLKVLPSPGSGQPHTKGSRPTRQKPALFSMVMPLAMAINAAEEQQPAVPPATRPTRGVGALSHSHSPRPAVPPQRPAAGTQNTRSAGPAASPRHLRYQRNSLTLSRTARKLRCENRAARGHTNTLAEDNTVPHFPQTLYVTSPGSTAHRLLGAAARQEIRRTTLQLRHKSFPYL